MVADTEEFEEMDASELHARRLIAKEVLTPQRSEIHFPGRRWNSQNPWRRSTSETIHLYPGSLRTRTRTRSFQGKSDGLHSPTPLQDDSTSDDAEAKNDFWTTRGEFNYRPHVVPRVKLHMPKEETCPIPTKYIDVTRTTDTS